MTHATRDAIEHGVMALDDVLFTGPDWAHKFNQQLTVARDELQKLLDTGLDADLAALRERCAALIESEWPGGKDWLLIHVRALSLHPLDDDPYEPKSVMHGDQEAT